MRNKHCFFVARNSGNAYYTRILERGTRRTPHNHLLPKFRIGMEEMYKPLKMFEYFHKKDPSALPSVCRLLGLPEGK